MSEIDRVWKENINNKVFLGSTSVIKAEAITMALGEVEVILCKSQSNIPEQPIGIPEILKGIESRIMTSINNGANGVVIAIENGIVRGRELHDLGKTQDIFSQPVVDDSWYEISCVTIHVNPGKKSSAISKAIPVPQKLMDEVFTYPDRSYTLGKVIADLYPDIDHQNPQLFMTQGKMGRVEIMAEAIQDANAQLLAT